MFLHMNQYLSCKILQKNGLKSNEFFGLIRLQLALLSHLLCLDLFSLSTSHNDALCAALVVLASTSIVPQSKVFISEALAQTSSLFPTLDRALKSNMEISSKLVALKRQKIEFERVQLVKKQAIQWLNELGAEYDAHKQRIKVLTKELEKERVKLTSLVEQGKVINTQWLKPL